MSGKRARLIRKQTYVYIDMSPQFRKYFISNDNNIIADKLRQGYQKAKKAWVG